MPVRFQHNQQEHSFYFITFTCCKWKHLFSITNAYDAIDKWFDRLYESNIYVTGYVFMASHVHMLYIFHRSIHH